MELGDDLLRGDADSANKEACLLLDDDVDELREGTLSVVVLM